MVRYPIEYREEMLATIKMREQQLLPHRSQMKYYSPLLFSCLQEL